MKSQTEIPVNAHFVTPDDQDYLLYKAKYKKSNREPNQVRRSGIRDINDIMGDLLERCIKHWVSKAQQYADKNIIKYYIHGKKKIKPLFKEVDFILQKPNHVVLGEIKSTISPDGNIRVAINQFKKSQELLQSTGMTIQYAFVWVDLFDENERDIFDYFPENYDEAVFRQNDAYGFPIMYMHLKAEDVFHYGVKEGVIKSPELFPELKAHLSVVGALKKLQHAKPMNESEDSSKEDLELENAIKTAKNHSCLSKMGYVVLDNLMSKNDLVNLLGSVYHLGIFSKEFISFSRTINYVCISGEQSLALLSSNEVYLMIPEQIKGQADEMLFEDSPKIHGELNRCYAFLERHPTRKFFYSGKLSRQEDAKKEAYGIVEKVLKNSAGIIIDLLPGQFLIFDNHRLLHKVVTKSSSFDTISDYR